MTAETKQNIINIILTTTTNTKSEIKKVLNPNSNFYRNPPYPIVTTKFPKDTSELLSILDIIKIEDCYSEEVCTIVEIENYLVESGEVSKEEIEVEDIKTIAEDYIDEIPLEEVIEVLAKKYNLEKEVDKWLN